MSKRYSLFILSLLSLFFISCKKTDFISSNAAASSTEGNFFSRFAANDAATITASKYVERKETQYHFTDGIIQQIGFPHWDKSIVFNTAANNNPSITASNNDATIVFIPFVRDTENVVNALMRITITPSDTSYKIICNWQYTDSVSTGLIGRHQSLLLMALNRSVFHDDLYKITDSLSFIGSGRKGKFVQILSTAYQTLGKPTSLPQGLLTQVTYTVTICYSQTVNVPVNSGNLTGCPPDGPCPFYTTQTTCEDITWVDYVDDGSGSSTPPTSPGTGGGGGGYDPPLPCTPVLTPVTTPPIDGDPIPPCPPGGDDGGWVPFEVTPCQKIQVLKQSAAYRAKCQQLKDSTGLNHEIGYSYLYPNDINNYQYFRGPEGKGEVSFIATNFVAGWMHSHYGNLLRLFSPEDFKVPRNLLYPQTI